MMKNLEYGLLLDCYGSLLTERQRWLLDGYYNNDLSLAELAGPLGVTRQAVHNSIQRGERQLEELEACMGVVARQKAYKACLEELASLAEKIEEESLREAIIALAQKGIAAIDA